MSGTRRPIEYSKREGDVHVFASVVIVSDIEKALEFYVDKLGWTASIDNQMSPDYRFVCVVPPGHSTGIVLGESRFYGMACPTPETPTLTNVYFSSDDVRAEYATLSERGVGFTQEPEMTPWGAWGARIVDPDGNVFFVSDGS